MFKAVFAVDGRMQFLSALPPINYNHWWVYSFPMLRLNSNMENTPQKCHRNLPTSFHQWKYYYGWLKTCQCSERIRALLHFLRFEALFQDSCIWAVCLVLNLVFSSWQEGILCPVASSAASLLLANITASIFLLHTWPLSPNMHAKVLSWNKSSRTWTLPYC